MYEADMRSPYTVRVTNHSLAEGNMQTKLRYLELVILHNNKFITNGILQNSTSLVIFALNSKYLLNPTTIMTPQE